MCAMKKMLFAASLMVMLLMMGLSSCSGDEEYNFYSTLYGTVSDSESGSPVGAATIVLSPGGKTTVSEVDGRYEFADLDVMQYTVTVQKSGYVTNRKTVTLVSGESVRADIPMTPAE